MGVLKTVAENINVAISFTACYFFLKRTHSCNWFLSQVFSSDRLLNLEAPNGRQHFILDFCARLAVLMFVESVLVMTLRIFTTKSSPTTEEDPSAIRYLNRVLSNNLEFFLPFFGLYLTLLYGHIDHQLSQTQLAVLAAWFLFSRLVHGVLYTVGGIIGWGILRSWGTAITTGAIFIMADISFAKGQYLVPGFYGSQ